MKSKNDPTQHINYAIFLQKVSGRETTKDLILRHVEHISNLDRAGKLVLCGPFSDHPSGLVVVKAQSKDEATAIAESDPFIKEGARTFEVRTWLIACRENNYLA